METSAPPRLNTVFLVDEKDQRRIATKWFLSNLGCTVETARSSEEALRAFDPKLHDVVVIGDALNGLSGAELAHIIKLRSAGTPVIMLAPPLPQDQACVDLAFKGPPHLLELGRAVQELAGRKG